MKKALKAVERSGRRHLAGLLRSLLPPASCAGLPDIPGSILVVRLDSRLGNLVLLEPLLRSLRGRFPGSRVAVLASDRFADILASQGYEMIPVPKALFASQPWRFSAFAEQLRGMEFEVAMDASHPGGFSLSGASAASLSGASVRIGFAAGDYPGWFSHAVPVPVRNCHESKALHSLGSVWDGWPAWGPPRLAARVLEPREAVGVHVGASRGKFYPPGMMKSLISSLAGRVALEIYWGGAEELEQARSLEGPFVTVMPKLDMRGLVERLAGLRAFVTADNGPMHVASALGVPVVALFRIPNAERFGPLSGGSRVLFDPSGADPSQVARAVLEVASGRR